MYYKFLCVFFTLIFIFDTSVCAKEINSGLSVLESQIYTAKMSNSSVISFDERDFAMSVGLENIDKIKIAYLPDTGTLYLNEMKVQKGQEIGRANLSNLRYVSVCKESAFGYTVFAGTQKRDIDCSLFSLSTIGEKQVITSSSYFSGATTDKNTKCYSTLYDDYENIKYSDIIKAPRHGKVVIINHAKGVFKYTPDNNFTGKDTFYFTLTDKYGKVSSGLPFTVTVR